MYTGTSWPVLRMRFWLNVLGTLGRNPGFTKSALIASIGTLHCTVIQAYIHEITFPYLGAH